MGKRRAKVQSTTDCTLPIVQDLKTVDDKYLDEDKEYEREVQELLRRYRALKEPLLQERLQVLTSSAEVDSEVAVSGTPGLRGFWPEALLHLPTTEDLVEEWDLPVLDYLRNVESAPLDSEKMEKGFRLTFSFVDNPYICNATIWKEYHTVETSPYNPQADVEIKVSPIEWKPGKDVTVVEVKKKKKQKAGGSAKPSKSKLEPRDSFFRGFFRSLKRGDPIPDDVNLGEAAMLCRGFSKEKAEEKMMGLLLENDLHIGRSVRDQLIPYAIRWYTGEAKRLEIRRLPRVRKRLQLRRRLRRNTKKKRRKKRRRKRRSKHCKCQIVRHKRRRGISPTFS